MRMRTRTCAPSVHLRLRLRALSCTEHRLARTPGTVLTSGDLARQVRSQTGDATVDRAVHIRNLPPGFATDRLQVSCSRPTGRSLSTLLYGGKGVLNGHSSTRVSLWGSLMFGRLAMGYANVRAGAREY